MTEIVSIQAAEKDAGIAAQAGTLGYELLTNLGRRFHRIWKV